MLKEAMETEKTHVAICNIHSVLQDLLLGTTQNTTKLFKYAYYTSISTTEWRKQNCSRKNLLLTQVNCHVKNSQNLFKMFVTKIYVVVNTCKPFNYGA